MSVSKSFDLSYCMRYAQIDFQDGGHTGIAGKCSWNGSNLDDVCSVGSDNYELKLTTLPY